MMVLGIDPGFSRTGFGVVTGSARPEAITFGVIAPKGGELGERLQFFSHEINGLLTKTRPDRVVLEKVFWGQARGDAFKTLYVRGIVLLAAADRKLPVVELSPASVKKAICGTGSASKRQIQETVAKLLDLSQPPSPPDAADALAIAIVGSSRLYTYTP
ncbi:MAG: crossover junction endodeoxyribonuclease RuvC [Candidatus Terrybacteria bacterium RIFCSPHIGHO2_01_FULL_48_17]|uniref:Crossover junction endodeoxyribonuclease RuvC n=1 Tax=Candidatus Terrybacteria bacterium RIFCSPHIGHO2_01_FULL_48_17 TaxID=1802362 RepID=A0A1G2PK81_9BACT|nr:MAG: crossover junction endodeoxyribonuclease RuvC [Candidatus Terrybacteria bacterium RIFCSPHIGHO2_01_FULL_48_17]OHA53412.1 MAG: crossover junction endodeoxyribonuclease RuvC [Candidatus Terrybacteria bacterium RIFCSPLOWO2_01_FULL_48_14]